MKFRIITSVEIDVDMNNRNQSCEDIIRILKSEAEDSAYGWYEDFNDKKINATVEVVEEKSE